MVQGGGQGKKVSTSKRMKMDPCHSVQKKKKINQSKQKAEGKTWNFKTTGNKNMRKKIIQDTGMGEELWKGHGIYPKNQLGRKLWK